MPFASRACWLHVSPDCILVEHIDQVAERAVMERRDHKKLRSEQCDTVESHDIWVAHFR